MIRTTAARPARAGAALAGVAGILALAGCAAGAPAAEADTGVDASYKDGTYTAAGSYATPESVETISVTVTLQDDTITDVEVTGDPQKAESQQYQGQFIGGIAAEVVGKDIDQLAVSRVAGSSLTSGGFNEAIEQIKQQAAE